MERIREIFETLTSGDTISTRSKSLNEVEALKSAIAEVEQSIRRMIIELRILNDSNGNIMLNSAGSTEAEWDVFFELRRNLLEQEFGRVLTALRNY